VHVSSEFSGSDDGSGFDDDDSDDDDGDYAPFDPSAPPKSGDTARVTHPTCCSLVHVVTMSNVSDVELLFDKLFRWVCGNCTGTNSFPPNPEGLAFASVLRDAILQYNSDCAAANEASLPIPDFPTLPPCPTLPLTQELTCAMCNSPALWPSGTLSFTLPSQAIAQEALVRLCVTSSRDIVTSYGSCGHVHHTPEQPPRTVITTDARMLAHEETKPFQERQSAFPGIPPEPAAPHPERPQRLEAIVAHLVATGVYQRCEFVPCREVTEQELALVHTPSVLETVASKADIPPGEVCLCHHRAWMLGFCCFHACPVHA
jgi:hypothetical protein